MPIDITNKEEKKIALTGTQIEETLLQAHLSKDAIEKIEGLEASASEINDTVKTEATVIDAKATYGIVQGMINASTGKHTTTLATYEATGYIPVTVGDVLTFSGYITNDVGFAGFDESQVFVEKVIRPADGVNPRLTFEYEVTNPQIKFIRGCNKISDSPVWSLSVTSPPLYLTDRISKVELDLSAMQEILSTDVIVTPASSTKFYVKSKTPSGEYTLHEFTYINDVEYNDIGWYSPWIYFKGSAIMQGNINTIHIMNDGTSDDGEHLGHAHGCEEDIYCHFFIDGKEFDPTNFTEPLYGKKFSITQVSQFYTPDSALSQADGAYRTIAKTPLEVRSQRYTDFSIEGNNIINRHHKLLIKKNNVTFSKLYFAMQQTEKPLFNGVIIANNANGDRTYFPVSSDTPAPLPPSTKTLEGGGIFATRITALGQDDNYSFKASTILENPLKPQEVNIQGWLARKDSNKFYFHPIYNDNTFPNFQKEIFNIGDVIEGKSVTTIDIYKK